MSREIKFRAWIRFMRKMTPVLELYQGGGVMVDCYEYAIESDAIDLMQFTGLQDKNGVDIYEGDIVACNYFNGSRVKSHNEVVEFKDGKFDLTWTINKKFKSFRSRSCFHGHSDAFLVIGNIYENPEFIGE